MGMSETAILQDTANGWFYRDNGDGTFDSLSDEGGATPTTARKVTGDAIRKPVTLVQDGVPTGLGDALATRVAVVMARRYAA